MTRTSRSLQGRAPWGLIVPAVLAFLFLVGPIVAIFVRAPWGSLARDLTTVEAADALRVSLQTTLLATLLCVLFGVPLAWMLARTSFRGRSVVRALVTLPLVLPPVVGGIALLLALGKNGIIGGPIDDAFGITFPFTMTAVVMAQSFVGLPFLVISVEGAFRASDTRYDEAAATLGASRWSTFRRVTLPMAMPGIIAGAVLCWARALGEFGATVTFAGNFPGVTRTMPVQIYLARYSDTGSAIALSLVLIVFSVTVLALLRERWLSGSTA